VPRHWVTLWLFQKHNNSIMITVTIHYSHRQEYGLQL
jgi:hypothetical protein